MSIIVADACNTSNTVSFSTDKSIKICLQLYSDSRTVVEETF